MADNQPDLAKRLEDLEKEVRNRSADPKYTDAQRQVMIKARDLLIEANIRGFIVGFYRKDDAVFELQWVGKQDDPPVEGQLELAGQELLGISHHMRRIRISQQVQVHTGPKPQS